MPKRKKAPALEDFVFVKAGAKGELFEALLVREDKQPPTSSSNLVCVQWVIRGGRAYVNASDVTPMYGSAEGGRGRRACQRVQKDTVASKKEPPENDKLPSSSDVEDSAKLEEAANGAARINKALDKKVKATAAPPNDDEVADSLSDTTSDEDEQYNVPPAAAARVAVARKPIVFCNQKQLRMKGNTKEDPIDLLESSEDESSRDRSVEEWPTVAVAEGIKEKRGRPFKPPSPHSAFSKFVNPRHSATHRHGRKERQKGSLKPPPTEINLTPQRPPRKYARKQETPSRAVAVMKNAPVAGGQTERVYVQPRAVPAPFFGRMIQEGHRFQQRDRQGRPTGKVDVRCAGISQFTAKRYGNRFPRLLQLIPQTGVYKSAYRAENDGFHHLPDQARVVKLKEQQYKDSDDEADMLESENSDDDASMSSLSE